MNNATINAMNRIVTAYDVAAKLGISAKTVWGCMSSDTDDYAKSTVEAVRKTAEEMGYQKKAYKARKSGDEKAVKYWYGGSFTSKKAEIQRMQELRDEGYTNSQIAKKIGRSINTVAKGIGKQPREMTAISKKLAGSIRRQRKAARAAYLRNAPIAEYNRQVAERNALAEQLAHMERRLSAQKAEADKAAARKIEVPNIQLPMLVPAAMN